MPLKFRLFFYGPRKTHSPREQFSIISKKESHAFSFYYRWRSAAVKPEPSRIHTLSLIKNNSESHQEVEGGGGLCREMGSTGYS